MKESSRRIRRPRLAVVQAREQLAPNMVRVIFTGEDLLGLPDLNHTDHYIKILFAPLGAGYRWPFDAEAIKATRPPEEWPVTRTYTIRSLDRTANRMAVDFVVHGDEGLAGPWAAQATPGQTIGFYGPGGGYAPHPKADAHLLVGDESAIPAIAAALDQLPATARAYVFLEVDGAQHHQPVPAGPNIVLTWVYRDGAVYGERLAARVRAAELPAGWVQPFVHGNARLVRDLRQHLFHERGMQRRGASLSGYWRSGQTEDRWQATKHESDQRTTVNDATSLAHSR